jgi:hypothetical protein
MHLNLTAMDATNIVLQWFFLFSQSNHTVNMRLESVKYDAYSVNTLKLKLLLVETIRS